MKVTGKTAISQVTAYWCTLMEMCMRVSGWTEECTVKVGSLCLRLSPDTCQAPTPTLTGTNTKVSGKTTNDMVLGRRVPQ